MYRFILCKIQSANLEMKIGLIKNNIDKEFTISACVSVMFNMNPSIVSSKRFVISHEDLERLKRNLEKEKYLLF